MENLMVVPRPSANQRGRELPHDIIRQILPRVPIRSLLRFKCVCKFWYDLITSSDFINKYNKDNGHNQNNNGFSIFIHGTVCDATSTTMSFWFFDVPIKLTIPFRVKCVDLVGCSNGLVCLSFSTCKIWPGSKSSKGFIIWNPGTGKFRKIDAHNRHKYQKEHNTCCGFLFDSVSGTFKVAQIEISYGVVEVYMFTSKDNSWKSVKGLSVYQSSMVLNTICVGTCVYWGKTLARDGSWVIPRFDMAAESLGFISLPDTVSNFAKLVGYKDTIAFFDRRNRTSVSWPASNKYKVWVLKDCSGESSWKRKSCIPLMNVGFAEGFVCKGGVNRVVVSNRSSTAFLCDLKTGERKELTGVIPWNLKFNLYSESFASVY